MAKQYSHKIENYIGKQFNKWTVLNKAEQPKHVKKKRTYIYARCECGYKKIINFADVLYGRSTQCRTCRYNNIKSMYDVNFYIGQKIGNRIILDSAGKTQKGKQLVKTECQCIYKTIANVRLYDLLHYKKNFHCTHCTNMTHGAGKNFKGNELFRTYRIWCHMKARCDVKTNPNYYYYGQRGIKYQESWENFENFLSDMGRAPDKFTLDRKNPNLHYTKENCQWVTMAENQRNKRNCKKNRHLNIMCEISKLCKSCLNRARNINEIIKPILLDYPDIVKD